MLTTVGVLWEHIHYLDWNQVLSGCRVTVVEYRSLQPVPYRSLLQEKIEPGQTLIVKGSTIDESQRYGSIYSFSLIIDCPFKISDRSTPT